MLINIKSNAYRDEEADEPINLITFGHLTLDDSKRILEYDETLDESLPAQHVTLTIEKDSMVMSRDGAYSTQMIFSRGQRYEGQYHTPYGAMELALFCNRLKWDLNETGGFVELRYQMDINGQFAAIHDLSLTVFPHNG